MSPALHSANLANTLGLEIEGVTLNRNVVSNLMKPNEDNASSGIKMVTRDASVESIARQLTSNMSIFMGNQFIRKNMKRSPNDVVIGYEIVTHPMDRSKMRQTVRNIMSTLNSHGEIYSPRSSVHVHTGFPYGLIFMKSAVALGLKVEPLLFKLAGMGNEYRGSINKSAYARPLCSPPSVKTVDKRWLCLDPVGALDAENETEFWGKFGIQPSETGRYIPLRYFAINIYSVLLRGTMEYRFFNYTPIARYIHAVVELCQFLSDLMIRVSLDDIAQLPSMSLFDANSNSSYAAMIKALDDLGDEYDSDFRISPDGMESLYELLLITPQPIFSRTPVKTHLADYAILDEKIIQMLPPVIQPVDPGIINVHNFSEADRSMLP